MIIVRIRGGLGNQLFQYAIGRKISLMKGERLKLDISTYTSANAHKYRLNYFSINADIASDAEIKRFTGMVKRGVLGRVHRILRQHTQRCTPYYKRLVVEEKDANFDHDIFRVSDNAYLDGYWQSENYFKDIEHTLRKELTLVNSSDEANQRLLENISNSMSVSLHIRRGDYLLPDNHKIHGVCPLKYYEACVRELTAEVKQPHFFVFSDDPQWARQNLRLNDYSVTYVNNNGQEKDYEDLRLISACKHHIIANSTFSWWGAWLCPYSEKIVIAPEKWFNCSRNDTKDLIPDSWRKIYVE